MMLKPQALVVDARGLADGPEGRPDAVLGEEVKNAVQ